MTTPKLNGEGRQPRGSSISAAAPLEPASVASVPAGRIIIDGESAAEFDEFRQRLRETFPDGGVLAEILAEQLAALLWRLRRFAGFEAGLISWVLHQQAQAYDSDGLSLGGHFFPADQRGLATPKEGSDRANRHRRHAIGRAVETAFVKGDALGRMGRYEVHLMRQAERVLAELRRLQGNRLAR